MVVVLVVLGRRERRAAVLTEMDGMDDDGWEASSVRPTKPGARSPQ
jgi:hypothetical protein